MKTNPPKLSPGQMELIPLLHLGNKQIASKLAISESAVRRRLEIAFRKCGVQSRIALLMQFARFDTGQMTTGHSSPSRKRQ